MIALALRSMAERKLRSALTALAILLGVAMVSGTFVQTDRIFTAFEEIEDTARSGTDVVISPATTFTSSYAITDTIDDEVLAKVRAVDGVAQAEGQILESGNLVIDGETTDSGFAPSIVTTTAGEPFSPLDFTDGRLPQRRGEVAVNAKLAEDEDLEVGRQVGLTTRTGIKPVTISGIAEYGNASSIGGATIVVGTLADIQRWFAHRGEVSEIVVAADAGVDDDVLADRLRAVLPNTLEVETGEENAQSTADEVNDSIGGFLNPALFTLAGAALLVGGFIIFNTFSITVAQRTREFGLLRAMGATRRQVMSSVVAEALALGVCASILGIACGLGFAALLGSLFDAAGFGIPAAGLELAPRTIVVSLLVGIGVTLVAAIVPARRATHVPPVAALTQAALPEPSARARRLAPFVSAGVSLLGLALLLQGLFGSGGATTRLGGLAGGALLLFIGIALVSRHLVRPLAAGIGWPLEHAFAEPGRLARDNAMRNPGRTATTSAALMVGLGLVVFVAVFASGLKASISSSLDDLVKADVIVTGQGFAPLASGAGEAITRADGVRALSPQYIDEIQVDGRSVSGTTDLLNGVDQARWADVYEGEWLNGGSDALFAQVGDGRTVVEEQFAKRHDLSTGERFTVETSFGKTATLQMIGEYRDPSLLQGIIVDVDTFRSLSSLRDPFAYIVESEPGISPEDLKERVETAVAAYPTAEVRTNEDYRQLIEDQVNTLVYLLYALLAMSLVISLFGIANSLFLSIHERVREFGLLRAVGATQAQVRRVVRYESVITSVIGGTLGVVVGVIFAALAITALSDLGLTFALPVAQLAVFLVLAVLVGVAGAVVPARRAAGVDVLEAMRHD